MVGTTTHITSDTAPISLTGRDQGGLDEGILISDGSFVMANSSAEIAITTFSDLIIDGGGSVTGGSGLLTLDAARDLIVEGGTLPNLLSTVSVGSGGAILRAGRNVLVKGGSGLNAHGQIIKVDPTPSADILIIAESDIKMESLPSGGEAQIINNSAGGLTLVVDNAFPSFPDSGSGGFFLNSSLIASGPLSIYTVEPTQNQINDTINGVPFVPTPLGQEGAFTQSDVYFSMGTLSGIPFALYYKLGSRFLAENIATLQIALSELSYRLPIFRCLRLPHYPWHHPNFCQYRVCDPGFDPYGSFIFEDNVYWIGD